MRGRATAFALLASVPALVAPSGAHGIVTIGSNLGRAPNSASSCAPPCTYLQSALDSDRQAAGGLVSPVNGTIVLWRVRTGSSSASASLRVIRPLNDVLVTGAGTSAPVVPTLNSTTSFTTQLPIAICDRIGLDCCFSSSAFFVTSGGTRHSFQPVLVDGAPGRSPTLIDFGREMTLNADIEPTSAFTISKVKLGKGGKVTTTQTLPNPGTLVGGDAGGKKKTRLFQPASMLAAVAGQTIRLLMKPTKRARALLAEKSRVKAKLKVVFTPTGGSPSAKVLKVKLKR
jgi:hypothetical protein